MKKRAQLVIAVLVFVGLAANAAFAVSIRDLVKLKAAGLGDDVLIALIESDGSVFTLGADDILSLREQGLSEKVIIAMLKTTRKPPAPAPARVTTIPPADTVEPPALADEPPPQVAQTAPVVVNVQQHVEQRVEQPRVETRTVHVPVAVAVPFFVRPTAPRKAPAPVFWGWGGQRRPDSWKDRDRNDK